VPGSEENMGETQHRPFGPDESPRKAVAPSGTNWQHP
jgi:hypothetical protein